MADSLSLDDKLALLLHNPRAFETWLRDHSGPIVGGTGVPAACPLANFLRARLGLCSAQDVRVFGAHVAVFHTWTLAHDRSIVQMLTSLDLPLWSRFFVRAIDAAGKSAHGPSVARPVSRDGALRTLHQITVQNAPEGAHEAQIKETTPTTP